ncbi:hypothetical protein [Pedobacter immunditicola]|uniref:hypothetical protein n=1 Tax=Pedobacter immunditicola TaxID=3133440 RepID=UPI0030AEB23F
MSIRSDKRKVLQQIVNKNEPGLEIDPESLLTTGDLHWFDALSKKQTTADKKTNGTDDEKEYPPSSAHQDINE